MRLKLLNLAVPASVIFSSWTQRAWAACSGDVSGGAQGGANCAQTAGAPSDLGSQIKNITNLLLIGIGIAAVIMLIIGGFRYIFSQGNEKNISGAKDTILYAVVGLVVAILSYAIVNFVIDRF